MARRAWGVEKPVKDQNTPHEPATGGRPTNRVGCLVVAIVFILLAIVLLAWVRKIAFEMANSRACINNLKQLGFALDAYHAEHGSFPPAYVADADGVPLYSWRVLLLPYLEDIENKAH